MNATTRNILIGVVVIVAVALLGYLVWRERQGPAPAQTAPTATSTGVSITVPPSNIVTSTAGYTITPVTGANAATPPSYKTPLSYPASMTADEQAAYQSQFASVQTTLASNPTDYSSWVELGILRTETGDYTGAAADWKYVTEIYPNDPTAFADLGDLYGSYLNQPSQGIANYKEAIKLDPTQEETFYQNLAQIYISQGDTADAKATLQQGITAQVVGYQNLQTELASMQ